MERDDFHNYCVLIPVSTDNCVSCPICDSPLLKSGKVHNLRDIFALWGAPLFPESVIQEHVAISPQTTLFRCGNCELEIFLPRVIGLPSFYEAASRANDDSAEGYYEDTKWDFDVAAQDVNSGISVIEFGCGPGNFLSRIRDKVGNAVGVELNSCAVKIARSKGLTVFDSLDFPGKNEHRFDAAFSFHVLEHVSDPLGFLESMKGQLKPGGRLGISVPNQGGPIRFIEPCAMNMPPHHATRWTLRTFEAAARKLDLTILRIEYEPLLLDNHSYYSIYWLKALLPSNSRASGLLRTVLSFSLRAIFGIMRRAGFKYFRPLRGQSIYVLMTKD